MKKSKKDLKNLKFKSLKEEIKFWDSVDLGDCATAKDFERVSFPNLKPSTKPISIRLPEYLINVIKEKANALDVPYQSLIKQSLHNIFWARA